MTRSRLVLSVLAAAVLVTAGSVAAQTPIDPLDARDARRLDRMEKVVRELRSIVFKGRDTGQPVVVQPADTDARIADLATRISDLEQSLRRVNGSLETATHQLDLAKRENAELKAQLQSLTERLGAAEAKMTPAEAAAPAGESETAGSAPTGDPTEAFAKARQLMLAGDYDAAEAAFADYVETWPDAARTAEARYWWGKTLSVRGAHADAATAYIGAIRGWPKTSWAPDAVAELARSLVALKKPQDACQALAELSRRYPKPPASVASRAAAVRAQAKCAA